MDMSSIADSSEVQITSILRVKMPVVGEFLCIYVYIVVCFEKTMRCRKEWGVVVPSGATAGHPNFNTKSA